MDKIFVEFVKVLWIKTTFFCILGNTGEKEGNTEKYKTGVQVFILIKENSSKTYIAGSIA